MADREVGKNSGIYEYLLTGKEKFLNLRQFADEDTRTAYEQQKGICPIAVSILILKKCTLTISRPGTQAVRLFLRTCRCCAGIVI